MLPVAFEEFGLVCTFLLLYPCHYHCQLVKVNTSKNLGVCSPLSLPGFYGPAKDIYIYGYTYIPIFIYTYIHVYIYIVAYIIYILLDIKIGVGASRKTVFPTSFGSCRFQAKF